MVAGEAKMAALPAIFSLFKEAPGMGTPIEETRRATRKLREKCKMARGENRQDLKKDGGRSEP